MRRLKYRLRPQGLIVAFGLWGVLGCSTQDTVGLSLPPKKTDPDLSNLPLHHDSAIVGTSGAVIAAGDAEVVIPQGALAEPVEIVVQPVQPASAPGLQTFPEMENETILEFLPHGTQFLRPVTIQVPHHHELSDDLALYTSEPNEPWAPVAGATFTDEFAKADVMHFSFFFTSPKPPPPPEPPPTTNSGGAGGAPSVEEAKGGSGGAPGAAGAGEPIVDPGDGQAGAPSTGVAGEGGAAGETGNDPGPIVAGDAGVQNPPPDPDPGAGGAGNSSGADAGVAGGAGAPDQDPGGTIDAGTGGSGGNDPPMQLDYLQNGAWHGSVYSLADDTSFVDRSGMCASGIVSADPQFQSFALWGWNLNQDLQSSPLSWDPTLQMMHYDVVSSTPLRLSLRDADGKDWCYVLPDARGDVAFTNFNSACWDDSGDFYNGTTPLVSLNVVVPGDDDTDVPFNLCVNDLFPENEPPAGDPGGISTGGSGGAGNTSGGADAGVAGEGGAPDGDPGAGGGSSGTVDAGTGTGGAPPVMDPDYLQNADWRGYLFSVADDNSTIDRVGVCASGSVASDPQSQSFAAWGWNLNEDKQGPVLSWDPTLQMMHYDVDSSAPVRLSLRDTDGKDWCYALPDVRGDVSFADFNSACWDNSGDFYNGTTPLVSLTVVVPGNDTAAVDFQLCVNDLFPEDGPFVPPPPPPPLDYLENKDWRGDLFTIADPTSSVERAGLCAAGTITSNAQFQSFGGWGWNLNQELQSLPLSWDPTLPMMHYDVDSTVPPRLALRDADGKDWCYVLPDARGDVSFTAFNSACWDNSGDFYDGTTPLVSIGTVIPGNDTTDVDFQLCVNELYPELEAPPPPPPPPQMDYRISGDWQGHLYSLADDTSFVDRSGTCASGVVSANAQFQSYALWGWNLNQQPDEPALSWDPTLQSIHYFIGSSTPLRLSLRDEQGQDWCYPIDTMTGDVLLTQFNSACWDNSGAFYDGTTPLMSINVVVPGNDIADVDFHFCVSDLFPQDPDAVGGGGGGSAGAGTGGVSGAGGASGASGSGGAPTAGDGGEAGAPAPPKL